MHPLRKLRESGKPTADQVSELLAENICIQQPDSDPADRGP